MEAVAVELHYPDKTEYWIVAGHTLLTWLSCQQYARPRKIHATFWDPGRPGEVKDVTDFHHWHWSPPPDENCRARAEGGAA